MILSLEGDMENATGGDFFYTHIYRIIKATNPKTGWPNRIIPIVRFWDLELVYRYLIRKNLFPIAIYIYIYISLYIKYSIWGNAFGYKSNQALAHEVLFMIVFYYTWITRGIVSMFIMILSFIKNLNFLWYHHSWYQINWQLWRIKHHFNPAIISLIYFVNCLHIFVI